jgi:large subunit ribosomal protein L5
MEEFGLTNPFEVPQIKKVTLNMGLGEAVQNPKVIDSAVKEMGLITGQKAVVTRARRSVATFKLREGMPIGAMVTLRGQRMWEFLDRLVYVALPRVRDFKGISDKAFDGHGNYSLGVREQIIFPEIEYDKVDAVRGMNITIVTSAPDDDQARSLLRHIGMPFIRREER